jgi:hypothetical protein
MRMMGVLVSLGVAISGTAALGKPLPKGMKVTLKDQQLYATVNGVTVPLLDAEAAAADLYSDLKSAELSDDGDDLVIKAEDCKAHAAEPEGLRIPLAGVEARVENVLGMQLHVKKKYADAIAHFATAVEKDPDTPLYATNLLSAQAMAKRLDDADRTLAAHGPAHLPWFAWRLAADPELASLRGRPSTQPLLPAKPSKLTWKELGAQVAVSPLGFVAVSEWTFFGGPGAPGGEDLAIYETKQGKLAFRIPVVALDDACGNTGMGAVPCSKQAQAHTAEHTRTANLVLATLGFERQPTVKLEPEADGNLLSADKQTAIEIGDGLRAQTKVKRGKLVTFIADIEPPKTALIAGNLVVLKYRENAYMGCSGDAQRSYSQLVTLK